MLTLKGHRSQVHSLAFSRDGTSLLSASGKGKTISKWNLSEGSRTLIRGAPHAIHTFRISPKSDELVAMTARGQFVIWGPNNPEPRAVFPEIEAWWDYPQGECPMTFDPAGEFLYVGNRDHERGSMFETLLPSLLGETEEPNWGITRFDLAAERESPFVSRPARQVRLMEFGFENKLVVGGMIPDAASILFFFAGEESRIDVLDPQTQQAETQWTIPHFVIAAASPAAPMIAIADIEELGFANYATREFTGLTRLEEDDPLVTALAFSPDGAHLACGDTDGRVQLWDVQTAKKLVAWDWPIGEVSTMTYSPDGSQIAAGGEKDILVWEPV